MSTWRCGWICPRSYFFAVVWSSLKTAAATIAGFAVNPLTALAFPEINTSIALLRDVRGEQTYEPLARKGETMTTAAMVTYAYDQIDQGRTELNAVSKYTLSSRPHMRPPPNTVRHRIFPGRKVSNVRLSTKSLA